MPATSDKQRKLMAIAEHHPEEVSKKNRGVLDMSKSQLHDYAATKGLSKTESESHPVRHMKRNLSIGDHYGS